MASQTRASNDRSRTYWTPTMEHHFVDLMLEHMQRGNRIGHTFNKQAWTDMLAVFNDKNGSQYDKDALKSRYTTLWKQFYDIKNLLGQSGFSWDETRQMLVADDYVWNAYLKAYPDARSYKTKPMVHFNDLCLIFGFTTADGRYSRSSHDLYTDDGVHGVNSGDGTGNLAPLYGERSKTDWTAPMDRYFIELMLTQKEKGNKRENTFSRQAWTDMLTLFNIKHGPHHSKGVLRHRCKKLEKYYSDATILLRQKGFSWDDKREMVAADDDVWDGYIKARPHLRSYRSKSLPNYEDLGLIFGDGINKGIHTDSLQYRVLGDDLAGVKSGSERSRTFWTPPMDHYLIDLLLDHLHRGNRIGQTFISQAWTDMVMSFNAMFKSHCDKDVLKNRYKHLRRHYNDIKILLEHDGFSWDETREMVTAEDHVWDSYIKAHPDARSYRVKTVPRYQKLSVVYGQDSYKARYSCLARNADSECKIPSTDQSERRHVHFPGCAEPLIDWKPPMDRCLIVLMLEQVQRGNKIDLTFDNQLWAGITRSFNKKLGLQYNKCVLQDRYMCLMKEYTDVQSLLHRDGFKWDETQQMVAADNGVWEAYFKENPHASPIRGKILGDHMDLCTILRDGIVDGSFMSQSEGMQVDHTTLGMEIIDICGDIRIAGTETETSRERKSIIGTETSHEREKRPTASHSASGRSTKVQKTGKEDIQEAFTDIVSKMGDTKADKTYSTIESAIDALQVIPNLEEELLLDACDLLADERKAKTFLALGVSLRKKWLLRKLGH